MLPELLRFSSSARLLSEIPEELQAVHRSTSTPASAAGPAAPVAQPFDLHAETDELDDSLLAELGL